MARDGRCTVVLPKATPLIHSIISCASCKTARNRALSDFCLGVILILNEGVVDSRIYFLDTNTLNVSVWR